MPGQPPDPFRQIDTLAVQVAEQYAAFVRAGIPPAQVATILGTMLGVALAASQNAQENPA